jgi:hypothetical protein
LAGNLCKTRICEELSRKCEDEIADVLSPAAVAANQCRQEFLQSISQPFKKVISILINTKTVADVRKECGRYDVGETARTQLGCQPAKPAKPVATD